MRLLRDMSEGSAVATLIGGALLFFSLIFFCFAGGANREADRALGLPILSRAELSDSSPGREALVEGRISPTMQARYQTLVAFVCERREVSYDSEGNSEERWVIDEATLPPLLLDTASGRVQVEADGRSSSYTLEHPPETFYADRDLRYRGFRANDEVLALGAVARSSEGPVLDAEFVYGGTQQSYIEDKRGAATGFFWAGVIAALVGVGSIIFGVLRDR